MKRRPTKCPRVPDVPVTRKSGESDQAYKCRIARERYLMVAGLIEEEKTMADFFKQVISADSRGVTSSFCHECDGVEALGHWLCGN